jgi:hypothetical protein
MKLSQKLGLLCASAAAIPLVVAAAILAAGLSSRARGQAMESLRSDSRAAAGIFEKRLEQMKEAALTLATDISIRGPVALPEGGAAGADASTRARLQDLLVKARDEMSLDFVIVADTAGKVIARNNDVPAAGETILKPDEKNPLAEKVLSEGGHQRASPAAACVIERTPFLIRLWLDKIARLDPYSNYTAGQSFSDGLMMEGCAPIYAGGHFAGIVLAGQMLNNFYMARAGASAFQTPLVTEIKRTLYANSDTDGGALAALGDTIVASSVQSASGTEPLLKGVKRSPAKLEETVESGQAEYVVVWQPVKSIDGSDIGAIGVALRSSVVNSSASQVRIALIAAVILAVVAAAAAGFWCGRSLSGRISVLTEAVDRMTVGELSAPVRDGSRSLEPGLMQRLAARTGLKVLGGFYRPEPTASNSALNGDEIGNLAEHLDQMRESFRQAIERLRRR